MYDNALTTLLPAAAEGSGNLVIMASISDSLGAITNISTTVTINSLGIVNKNNMTT